MKFILRLLLLPLSAVSAMATSESIKRVLVTGANKGIGKATCQLLLEKYPDVHVILGARDLQRGQSACNDIKKAVPGCEDRLEVLQLDTSSDDSVKAASASLKGKELFGIVNNAGIGWRNAFADVLNTNYFGPRRVNDAFGKLLKKPGGRIVNVSSASGPMFVYDCTDGTLKKKMTEPVEEIGTIDELDKIAKSSKTDDGYGLSKALLNAYTILHAKTEPDLIINSVTPGYINTDMTKGMGASNPPSKGAIPQVFCLMDLEGVPSGRYYGSDCVRSPIFKYRGPGDPPYEGP